jgi:CCR4-NOT transcription complex subunit 1
VNNRQLSVSPREGSYLRLRPCARVQGLAASLPVELLPELQAVQASLAKQFPALAPHVTAVSPPEAFASDVEEEANGYFQAIYNESRPIDEIISRMQAYKASPNPREQEVFACMIHNLFDEYRFFARYPDRELHITAALFGSLIKHGLVRARAVAGHGLGAARWPASTAARRL